MRKLNVIPPYLLAFVLAIAFLFSCKNEPAGKHADALPHNMQGSEQLTETEAKVLAEASGKSAQLISPGEFNRKLIGDTSKVTVINFWTTDCEECLSMQSILQKIQIREGNKLRIIALNLDPSNRNEMVNVSVRTAGITSEVYQFTENSNFQEMGWAPDLGTGLPALTFVTEGSLMTTYQRSLTENELLALLNPFLL